VPPKTINLNKGLNEKSEHQPKKFSQHQVDVAPLPQHTKYPYARRHDEAITVDELRSRVYQGTVGVLPLRKSQEIDGLNLMMKGKTLAPPPPPQIQIQHHSDNLNKDSYVYYEAGGSDEEILGPIMRQKSEDEDDDDDDDEGIDESSNFGAEHFHANTPATPNNYDKIPSFSNKYSNPYKQQSKKFEAANNNNDDLVNAHQVLNDYYYQELLNFRYNQSKNKPAILPQTGTTGRAQYSKRPKPLAKPKTLTEEFKLKKIKATLNDANLMMLDEDERHQLLMENEVKNLVEDAKKFAKLAPVCGFNFHKIMAQLILLRVLAGQLALLYIYLPFLKKLKNL
jgi:hypothetical protein